MPGISISFHSNNFDHKLESRISSILQSMCHYPDYNSKILFHNKRITIGVSAYKLYPVQKVDLGNSLLFLEGRIYNKSAETIHKEVTLIAEIAFDAEQSSKKLTGVIQTFCTKCDGEFWFILLDKETNKCLIVNDCYGKLPLYYYAESNSCSFSREVKFIQRLHNLREIDKTGMVQALVLRYPFSNNTLLKNIKKMPFASLAFLENESNTLKIENYHQFDLSEFTDSRSLESYAEELVDIFSRCIRNRESDNYESPSLIGLSGGLDSRGVLAGLMKNEIDTIPASSIDSNQNNLHDVDVAEKVARIYDLDFRRILLNEILFKDYQQIIELKDGLNSSAMAVSLGLYNNLLSDFKYGTYFYTGDGGASVKTPYRNPKTINSEAQLIKHIFQTPAVFKNHILKQILNFDYNSMINDTMDEINNYPASSWSDKYFYYTVFDYLTYSGYEGEDRTRFFFWTQTPYEAIPFYSMALRIPDKYKKDLRLFAKFLKFMDPRLLKVEYADLGANINSVKARLALQTKSFLKNHPKLIRIFRKIYYRNSIKPSTGDIQNKDEIVDLINHSELINQLFNRKKLLQLFETGLNSNQYQALLTIILYMRSIDQDYS